MILKQEENSIDGWNMKLCFEERGVKGEERGKNEAKQNVLYLFLITPLHYPSHDATGALASP